MKRDNKDVSYADVIVDISHESVDRPFTYRIPDALRGKLETGMSVLIPFGRGDKLRQGYVTAFRDSISFEESKVKEIADIAETDTAVDAILVRLAGWIRQQYGSTMIAALKTVLPAKQKKQNLEKKQICRRISGEEAKALADRCAEKRRPAMARLLLALAGQERLPMELVRKKLHISPSTINSLEKQGAISVETLRIYRNPVKDSAGAAAEKNTFGKNRPVLSRDQQKIVESVLQDYDRGVRKRVMDLQSVTDGSMNMVDLKNIAFISAAAGGKDSNFENGNGIRPVYEGEVAAWKLTIKNPYDEKTNPTGMREPEISNVRRDGGAVCFDYKDLYSTGNCYLSAVLLTEREREIVGYDRLVYATERGVGTIAINWPSEYDKEGYILKVFAEKYNGDNMTDYISEMQYVYQGAAIDKED